MGKERSDENWDECWADLGLCDEDHMVQRDCMDHVAQKTQITQASGSSATIIPAVLQVTNSTITSEVNEKILGFECQNQHENTDFHVCGLLSTDRYECAQEQECMNSCWQQAGVADSEYCHSSPTNCEVGCGCHNLHAGVHDDLTSTRCNCFHGIGDGDFEGDLQAHTTDPEDDIERRINGQIYHAIGDILSNAINRCISTSLEGCIDID
jgi:hypothetical protein